MLAALIPVLGPIVDRLVGLIPNENERAKAKEELERSISDAANKVHEMQAQTNMEEAKHSSIFVAGWRPFLGWICGVGLGWTFVLQPIITYILSATGVSVALPIIPNEGLLELVLAMLGLGGLRTFEKLKQVAR